MTIYVITLLVVAAAVAVAVLRPRTGAGLTWLAGLALVYVGQRLYAGDEASWIPTVAGALVVLGSFGARAKAMSDGEGPTADAQRTALIWQAVGSLSVLLWFLGTPTVTDTLGLSEDAYTQWSVSLFALAPIVGLVGAVPMLLIDQALGAHPVVMPPGAQQQATQSGLALALGLCLVFPINYLADAYDTDADFSYFRVTEAGSSTVALVQSLDEPVEVLLFYPPANDVKEELLKYFEPLVDASGGTLSLKVLDQPMEPELSKELTVRDNGYVVFRQGDSSQKFKLDTKITRARRDLKKLDGTVQKHLLKIARDKRTVYMLTGHGEASPRSQNVLLKLTEFKKLLVAQNYQVKDLGVEQGSATSVPSDAALVIVPAPEKALLPEESEALAAYVDDGGALLVYADPNRDPMAELLGHLGVAVGTDPLAHASKFVPMSGGVVDRANLFSQRFGSHASTSTLSKYATRAAVVLPTAVAVSETGETAAPGPAKHVPLIRSYEETWEDANGNFQKDAGEDGAVQVLAMAVEGPEAHPYRAIVVGDVSIAADFVLQRSQGAAQFAYDAVRWLVGDDDLTGEVNNEEDVRIEHTREDDAVWFYGTIFGVPLLVLLAGIIFVRRRTST